MSTLNPQQVIQSLPHFVPPMAFHSYSEQTFPLILFFSPPTLHCHFFHRGLCPSFSMFYILLPSYKPKKSGFYKFRLNSSLKFISVCVIWSSLFLSSSILFSYICFPHLIILNITLDSSQVKRDGKKK